MEQEPTQKLQVSIREILALASVIAVIAMIALIHAHFATFRRWMEALFWASLGVIVMIFVIIVLLAKSPNIPTNRIEYYMWKAQRAENRIRKGRSDEELSGWEKEHIQKIRNYYQDKIDRLYD